MAISVHCLPGRQHPTNAASASTNDDPAVAVTVAQVLPPMSQTTSLLCTVAGMLGQCGLDRRVYGFKDLQKKPQVSVLEACCNCRLQSTPRTGIGGVMPAG